MKFIKEENLKFVEENPYLNTEEFISVSEEELSNVYTDYLLYQNIAQHRESFYGLMSLMARYEPNKLLHIWSKISEVGELSCPEDIDEELLYSLQEGTPFMVQNELYEVDRIDETDVYFIKSDKKEIQE